MSSAAIRPERLARALTLLSYLLDEGRGELVPLADIKADLGLAPAEVHEDLELLNLVNHGGGTYVIYGEIEGEAVRVTREVLADSHARPARLSPLMARALLLTLDLVGDMLPGEDGASLAAIRAKVENLVQGLELGRVGVADLVTSDSQVVSVLNQGLRKQEKVKILYYTPAREELSERLVEPYLLFHSGNAWYLESYCLLARAPRTFRLDLVRAATPTGEPFSPRPDMDLSSRRAGSLAASVSPRWATLCFPLSRSRALAEQGLAVTSGEDGKVRARIPYLDARWLVREVVRQAGEAVLEEPRDLREEVARLADELLENYQPAKEPLDRRAGYGGDER